VISLGAVRTIWKHSDASEWWELHSLTASHPRQLEFSGREKLRRAESALGIFQVLNKFAIFKGTS